MSNPIILPNGYEVIREKKAGAKGTVERAMSIGFEDAIRDKGKECDYEFRVGEKDGFNVVIGEVKVDNGYFIHYKHKEGDKLNLNEIERDAYKFLIERL